MTLSDLEFHTKAGPFFQFFHLLFVFNWRPVRYPTRVGLVRFKTSDFQIELSLGLGQVS